MTAMLSLQRQFELHSNEKIATYLLLKRKNSSLTTQEADQFMILQPSVLSS